MTPPFVRRVELEAVDATTVLATIEDFNHHFDVTLRHDGRIATGLSVDAVRAPWSLCGDAGAELAELVGAPLGVRPATRRADQHCTHQIDTACVAVRFAGLGVGWRRFDVTVTGYDEPVMQAAVERDDGYRLEWTVEHHVISVPERYAGRALGAGFTVWAVGLEPDEAEAALILRRAAWMSPSRGMDLDDFPTLADSGLGVGVCFSAQPERIRAARRNVGMARVEVQPPRRN